MYVGNRGSAQPRMRSPPARSGQLLGGSEGTTWFAFALPHQLLERGGGVGSTPR